MLLFLCGLLLFLGIHSVSIVAPLWRSRQIGRYGEGRWKGIYSVMSALSLTAIIYGYGLVRYNTPVLYDPPIVLRHIALLVMLPVFPLLIAAYLPGRLSRLARHPMLLAIILWGIAHLLANGSLVDVLFFGGFLVWALVDRVSVSQRTSLTAHVVPSLPAAGARNDVIAVLAGIIIYGAFIMVVHRWIAGVSPLP